MGARRDLASPLTELLGVIVLSVILYVGGRLVLESNGNGLNGGELMTYIASFAMLINPAKNISTAFFNIQRGDAALKRVEEIDPKAYRNKDRYSNGSLVLDVNDTGEVVETWTKKRPE